MVWPFGKNTIKSLGFIADQKGIIKRYKRERTQWEGHLEKSKNYIYKQTIGKTFSSVAVLGSGFLLDLPIAHLLQISDKIYLYDINHPKEIKRQYSENKQIQFISKDITGLCDKIYSSKSIDDINTMLDIPVYEWAIEKHDLIISLNLLNQLDILLIDYLSDRMTLPLDLENKLRSKIQSDHIKSFGDTFSILIADVDEIQVDSSTNITQTKLNLHTDISNQGLGVDYEKWIWDFDSNGRYIENALVKLKVNAVTYNKQKTKCAE